MVTIFQQFNRIYCAEMVVNFDRNIQFICDTEWHKNFERDYAATKAVDEFKDYVSINRIF